MNYKIKFEIRFNPIKKIDFFNLWFIWFSVFGSIFIFVLIRLVDEQHLSTWFWQIKSEINNWLIRVWINQNKNEKKKGVDYSFHIHIGRLHDPKSLLSLLRKASQFATRVHTWIKKWLLKNQVISWKRSRDTQRSI